MCLKSVNKQLHSWIILAVAVTGMCGLVAVAVQQDIRQSTNDPQIEIARDAAADIADGASPQSVIPARTVAIERSLAPFVLAFDDNGTLIASSGMLDGHQPSLPAGVFAYTRTHGEDRVTWQPRPGVRSALVIEKVNGGVGGFVAAGRSLAETERRVESLYLHVAAAWFATLLITALLTVAFLPRS